jgi:hypothetical protein
MWRVIFFELNMDLAAYFESQLIDYDVCSNWQLGLFGRS